jgi:hypothetical protein
MSKEGWKKKRMLNQIILFENSGRYKADSSNVLQL